MACPASLHVLAARATRLNSDGSPATGATASYVTAHPMRVGLNPEVEEGEETLQRNGAGRICVIYRAPDEIKYWNLELDNCRIEPALFELMIEGMDLIPGAGEEAPIGNILPSGIGDGSDAVGVGIEFWTRAWDGDAALAGTPYIRWYIPKAVWTLGDNELSAEALTVSMTGRSENNPAFGDPYGDHPATFTANGRPAYFFDDFLPEAACDYAALASGSGS